MLLLVWKLSIRSKIFLRIITIDQKWRLRLKKPRFSPTKLLHDFTTLLQDIFLLKREVIYYFSNTLEYTYVMNAKAKATYRLHLKELFYKIKGHPLFERVMILPFSLRIFLGFLLFIFWAIGLFTPIPAWWVMIGIAATLVFGIREAQRYSIRLFFLLRIHKLLHFFRYRLRR